MITPTTIAERTTIQSRFENLKIVSHKKPKNNTANATIICPNSMPISIPIKGSILLSVLAVNILNLLAKLRPWINPKNTVDKNRMPTFSLGAFLPAVKTLYKATTKIVIGIRNAIKVPLMLTIP